MNIEQVGTVGNIDLYYFPWPSGRYALWPTGASASRSMNNDNLDMLQSRLRDALIMAAVLHGGRVPALKAYRWHPSVKQELSRRRGQ